MRVIRIEEAKKEKMSEHCEKALHHLGKLMTCIEDMGEGGYGERDDEDDDEENDFSKKGKSDKDKSKKKFSDKDRKMNFSNVVVSSSDLDFDDDDDTQEKSASLTSAMEFVGTRQHRRSFASIKRQKEKNYRKFVENQAPKEKEKTSVLPIVIISAVEVVAVIALEFFTKEK